MTKTGQQQQKHTTSVTTYPISLHVYQYQFRDDNLSCPVLTSRIYDDVDVVDEKKTNLNKNDIMDEKPISQ